MTWKQVAYYGYSSLTTDGITDLVNGGATHIILEFIVLYYSGSYYYLSLEDTVSEFAGFSSSEKTAIYNATSRKNLMLSFGGANSKCILDAIGKQYKSYTTGKTNTFSADLFVTDISTIIDECSAGTGTAYNIDGIDLDIEGIDGSVDTTTAYTLLGQISEGIRAIVKRDGTNPIVTHAPQTPYFNVRGYGFIYTLLDYYYGTYISFYNVQYYNQGDNVYENYIMCFYDDSADSGGSIGALLQIANASDTINGFYGDKTITDGITINTSKLVIGKMTSAAYNADKSAGTDPTGYVTLWTSGKNSYTYPTMTYFVNISYNYTSPNDTDSNYPTTAQMASYKSQLNNWVLYGGIMCWLYNPDYSNTDLLGYFSNNTGGTCFVKDTNILCFKNDCEIEINIEDLNVGDFVKTHKNEYKKIIYIGYNFYKLEKDIKNNVKYIKKDAISNNIPNKDLYLTNGHSLLFNDLFFFNELYDSKYYPENEKIDNYTKIMVQHLNISIENDKSDSVVYYHFVLENEDSNGQYGVYANNVLCESMSYNHIEKANLIEKKN